MIPPHHLLLFLTALAPTAHSHPQPPTSDLSPIHHPINLTSTPQPTTNPSSPATTAPPNSPPHCCTNPTPFIRRRKPRFPDCDAAILALPSTHTPGTFHTDNPADQFRLPVTRESGTCSVKVDIQRGVTEGVRGTWLDVGLVAMELNTACVKLPTFPIKIGGWATTGVGGGIVVSMKHAGDGGRVEWG